MQHDDDDWAQSSHHILALDLLYCIIAPEVKLFRENPLCHNHVWWEHSIRKKLCAEFAELNLLNKWKWQISWSNHAKKQHIKKHMLILNLNSSWSNRTCLGGWHDSECAGRFWLCHLGVKLCDNSWCCSLRSQHQKRWCCTHEMLHQKRWWWR